MSSVVERALLRERAARREAEKLLEQKSLELYEALALLSENLGRRTTELEESEARSRKLVEMVPEAIWVESHGSFAFLNDAAIRLLEARTPADLLGTRVQDRIAPEHRAELDAAVRRIVDEQAAPKLPVIQLVRMDGSLVDVEMAATTVQFQNGASVLVVARDISERKRHEAALEHQAMHDVLTGLANKALFHDRLDHAIERAERSSRRFAVLFVDLDKFKFINDSHGHGAGDDVLRTVAQRLKSGCRSGDTLARFGGDEFAVLIDSVTDEDALAEIVKRIMENLAAPVTIMEQEHKLTCSIGISIFPKDGASAEVLLKHADIAMYRAKDSGRNNFQFFTCQMQEQLHDHLRLEKQLHRALERSEFVLHYQPLVELRTGHIVGLEALIRWQPSDPDSPLILPAHFIPVAVQSNLIHAIGEWVVHSACAQAKAWLESGLALVPVSVNVSSSRTSHQGIEEIVMAALDFHRLDARFLELELTESMWMANPEASIAWMQRLHEIGVSISIDDFGTGYSNLSYLTRFPVGKLKIDRSFIKGITTDAHTALITTTIIRLAHGLGMRATAEGVENAAQLRFLIAKGCDEIQGYYFSKPLPAAEMDAMIRNRVRLALEPSMDSRTDANEIVIAKSHSSAASRSR